MCTMGKHANALHEILIKTAKPLNKGLRDLHLVCGGCWGVGGLGGGGGVLGGREKRRKCSNAGKKLHDPHDPKVLPTGKNFRVATETRNTAPKRPGRGSSPENGMRDSA